MSDEFESPDACAHCGIDAGGHRTRWSQYPVGRHRYTAPTDAQRLERMKVRRYRQIQANGTWLSKDDGDTYHYRSSHGCEVLKVSGAVNAGTIKHVRRRMLLTFEVIRDKPAVLDLTQMTCFDRAGLEGVLGALVDNAWPGRVTVAVPRTVRRVLDSGRIARPEEFHLHRSLREAIVCNRAMGEPTLGKRA